MTGTLSLRGAAGALLASLVLALGACGGGSGRSGTDVVVSGAGPADAVQAGTDAVFTMTVRNAGDYAAEGVSVVNQVGNQLALMSITCAASGGAVCPEALGVSMLVPRLPAGGRLDFTVTAQLSAGARGTVSNSLSASFEIDTDRSNNSATVTATTFSIASDLVVTGAGPGGTVAGGSSVDFQMRLRNDGPDAATNVRIVNNPGTALLVSGVSCAASGGATCPAAPGVQMDLAQLPAGGVLDFTVSATVAANVNGTVTNTMQVTADADADRSNNSFTASATVVTASAGVFVTGVGPADPVAGGGVAVFVMTVSNSGPGEATGVTIVDTVGSNLTFTGVACAAAGGATCPAALGPVMSVPLLPAGGSLVFTVSAVVANGISGVLTNTLTASATNDSNRNDNAATAVATAKTPRAALVLSGQGPAAPVAGGSTTAFDMTVTNTGPDAATGLRVLNTVGSNLSFLGATCSASGGAACPAAVGVISDVGNLPVGGQLQFRVNALVAAGANGAITNTLQATADNVFSPGGNSVVAVGTAVTARASLAVTGTGPSNVPAGSAATFRMTVSNSGPDIASAVRLVNSLGGNLTLTGVSCAAATGGAVCPAVPGVVMDVATLPVNGALAFDVSTVVAAGTQGAILNTLTATVNAGTRSETTGIAVGSAYAMNVAVSGSGPAGPLPGGATGEFTMDVTNNGPGTALDVALDNTLSAGLSLRGGIVCVQAINTSCPGATGASMLLPSLPAGASVRFSVPFTVNAGTNGTVANTLSATAAGDFRAVDNSATVGFTATSVDLGITQTGAAQVNAGDTVVFTAVLANPGPGTATNLTLTHALSGAAGTAPAIVCTPSAGATCPATGAVMNLASLGPGRSLVFTVTAAVPADGRGSITSSFALSSDGDPNAANNSAVTVTTAVDPRNGTYRAFAANGKAYDYTIDFDAGQYTMAGAGNAQAFTAAGGNDYVVAGAVRFRGATDLIVGNHDFGAGVLPYVAARRFGSTVAEAAGQYNLATRDVPTAGPAVNHAGVVAVSGNQLILCQEDAGEIAPPGARCPAGRQKAYVLSVLGNVYRATDVAGGDGFTFSVVRSDAARYLVGASATAAGDHFRIGLPDAVSLIGGSHAGASSSGGWIPSLNLTPASYAITGSALDDTSSSLTAIPNTGVGAMLVGNLAIGGDRVWVMQAAPLVVVFGDFTAAGAGRGLIQVALP